MGEREREAGTGCGEYKCAIPAPQTYTSFPSSVSLLSSRLYPQTSPSPPPSSSFPSPPHAIHFSSLLLSSTSSSFSSFSYSFSFLPVWCTLYGVTPFEVIVGGRKLQPQVNTRHTCWVTFPFPHCIQVSRGKWGRERKTRPFPWWLSPRP